MGLVVLLLIFFPFLLFSATWNLNANGNWNVNGNWTAPATFPNAIDAQADLLTVITASRTITLGQDITVGILNIDDNNQYTIQSGADSLIFEVSSGSAEWNVTNNNGNATHRIDAAVTLNSTLEMTYFSNSVLRFEQTVSGTGGLTIASTGGTGELRLDAANTYSGSTVFNSGELLYNFDGALPGGTSVTVGDGVSGAALLTINQAMSTVNAFDLTVNSNGTVDQNAGDSIEILSLAGSGSIAKSTGGTSPNYIDISGSTSTTYSGVMSGGATNSSSDPASNNRLLKSGTSTLTLSGANTYVCRTFIQDGVINAQNNSALGTSGTNSATYVQAGGTLEIENDIILLKTLNLNGTGSSGDGAIHNVGGDNEISGPVAIGWSGGIEPTADVTIQVDTSTSLGLSADISGANSLTLIGGGTLTFSGAIANTYTGDTIINGGTLDLDKTGVNGIVGDVQIGGGNLFLTQANQIANTSDMTIDSGSFDMNGNIETINSLTFNGGTLIHGGATLTLSDGTTPLTMRDTTISGNISISGGAVTFDATNNGTATISGNINQNAASIEYAIGNGTASIDMSISGVINTGSITKTGLGTLELTGANTYGGGTTVSAGTLQGNTTGLQGNITNNAAVVFSQSAGGTYSGIISSTGSLGKEGAGTVILTGANIYSGGTTISAGALQGNTTSLQGDITDNASLIFNQTVAGTFSDVISGTGSLTKIGAGTLTLSGANIYLGGTTVSVGALQGDTTSLQGDITNNASVIFNQGVGGAYAGSISGTGSLTKIGVGTLTLTSTNTYSGGTTVSAGALQGNSAAIQGDIVNNASVIFDQALGGTYSGAMSGTGSLTKIGAATLTLSGTNSYLGGTTISAGTLQGTTSSLQENITNDSAISFNQATGGTYSGIISGIGSFTKLGAGTVILTGANAYLGGTTISEGALQGNTTSFQGNITDDASLIFNQTIAGTFSDVISGSGTLTKIGGGTLTLTGTNTYSGGTTVSAGTLQGDTTSLQGAIVNSATVTFDQATPGTYAGAMSGTGGLTKIGADTLTLSGANSYSGGTLILVGGLVGTSTSLQGSITNLTSVTFNQGFNGTYSGAMDGTGSLIKLGTGTLIVSGANSYTGGTTVSAGILQGNTASLQGNIANAATLVFNQITDGSYGDSITGVGDLTKQGAGSLNLINTNTIGGTTSINEGTLFINGILDGAGTVAVASGAVLGGAGTINKSITVGGTLAPGNSIDTITIVGDVTLISGSTLEIELNFSSSDLINITGSLTIDPGATLAIIPNAGTTVNDEYLIVDTTGGVTGTFTTVTNTFPFIDLQVIYTTNQILLQQNEIGASFPIFKGNAGKVAKCLNSFTLLPGTDISDVALELDSITSDSKLENALLQLQPSAFTALSLVQESNVLEMRNTIYQHLEAVAMPCQEKLLCSKAHVWISGINEWSRQKNQHLEAGYKATSPGVVIGADAIFGGSSNIGVAIGYTHSALDWKKNRGSASINSFYLSAYGQYLHPRGFLMGSLIESFQHFKEKRKIKFGTIKRTAQSNHNGLEGSAHLKGGLFFHKNPLTFAPFVKVDYLYLYEESYNESGASSLDLSIDKKKSDLLVAGIGFRTSSCIMTKFAGLTPHLSLAAIWENRFQGKKISANFNGCSLDVKGLNPSRWLLEYAVGVNYQNLFKNIRANLLYEGKYSPHFLDNSIYLELGTCF